MVNTLNVIFPGYFWTAKCSKIALTAFNVTNGQYLTLCLLNETHAARQYYVTFPKWCEIRNRDLLKSQVGSLLHFNENKVSRKIIVPAVHLAMALMVNTVEFDPTPMTIAQAQ